MRDSASDRPFRASTDQYVHDAWNRLVEHAIDGTEEASVADYEYNALHWRTVKRRLAQSGVTPQERRLYYSAAWQVIQEDIDDNYASDPGIDRVSQQVWGLRYIDDAVFRRGYNPDIMEEEPEAHHYHVTDAQFSTIAMIGTGANPVLFERVRYRPYGEAVHRFPGDFDDDSYCNSADQTLLTNALNATIGQGAYDVAIDLNRDGVINSSDQTQFNWWSGRTPLSAGRISDAGNSTAGPGPDNPLGYCGYAFNAENLLYTVRFRWYEPVSGRWMERDPAGYLDGGQLYLACRLNPISRFDTLGLASCDENDGLLLVFQVVNDQGLAGGPQVASMHDIAQCLRVNYRDRRIQRMTISTHAGPGQMLKSKREDGGEVFFGLNDIDRLNKALANQDRMTCEQKRSLLQELDDLATLGQANVIYIAGCNIGTDDAPGAEGAGTAFLQGLADYTGAQVIGPVCSVWDASYGYGLLVLRTPWGWFRAWEPNVQPPDSYRQRDIQAATDRLRKAVAECCTEETGNNEDSAAEPPSP